MVAIIGFPARDFKSLVEDVYFFMVFMLVASHQSGCLEPRLAVVSSRRRKVPNLKFAKLASKLLSTNLSTSGWISSHFVVLDSFRDTRMLGSCQCLTA